MEELKNETAFADTEELYGKKVVAVPTPNKKRDIDVDDTLYDNIIEAGISSQLDITSLNQLNVKAQNRNEMYNIYDTMCEDGTISAVIETYAEDATERNDSGNIVWVEAADSKVSQIVNTYLDNLNVNKNIYKWVHSLCKYGDLYLHIYRDSEYNDDLFKPKKDDDTSKTLNEDVIIKDYKSSDKYAQYIEMVSNPAEMFEVTKFGKTVGYIKAPVNSTLYKKTNIDLLTFQYKFKKNDVVLYPATDFVHACLEDNSSREEEIISIFLEEDDYENNTNEHSFKVKKGQSLLSNVYKIWRELSLLENSVLLNRLTKSAIIRLINIEVGDMPKDDVGKTLRGIKNMVEQKTALNMNKSMSEYTSPGPIENNVYVPTHNGIGAITTSEIGGNPDVKSLLDLDYYTNKMFGQLRVPKQYFSNTDDSTGFNGGTSLSIISSRYAKMIKRIQNTVIQALTDVVSIFLLNDGLEEYINEFTLHMLPPTTQEEIDRRENLSGKVQLTSDIMNMLADIENPVVKLKILKSLMANIVDDSEILEQLQAYIEELEQEVGETFNEEVPEMGAEDMSDEFNDSIGGLSGAADIGMPEDEMSDESSSEDVLPSGDDLGVDLSDSAE